MSDLEEKLDCYIEYMRCEIDKAKRAHHESCCENSSAYKMGMNRGLLRGLHNGLDCLLELKDISNEEAKTNFKNDTETN